MIGRPVPYSVCSGSPHCQGCFCALGTANGSVLAGPDAEVVEHIVLGDVIVKPFS